MSDKKNILNKKPAIAQSLNQLKMSDWLRFVFDTAVIVVMVLALISSNNAIKVAHEANKITFQSLRSSYVPWTKLTTFSIEQKTDSSFDMNFSLKNYSSNAPAINLTIRSITPKILNEKSNYLRESLMPNEVITHTLSIEGSENKPTIDALRNGDLPVRISVKYSDIFNQAYEFEQEIKMIGGKYRMTDYYAIKMPLESFHDNN